ncbi:MAG: iron-sulfur cluster assembly accessory protein [Verrucomicrobiota bacterium]
MITVTDSAVKQLKSLIEGEPAETAGKSIRLFVQKGGCCSNPNYGMALDEPKEDDEVLDRGGVQFVVDPGSAEKLRGSVIDFHEGPEGSGFRIQNSSPAEHACGCDHEEGQGGCCQS